jgi:hypothetical protein
LTTPFFNFIYQKIQELERLLAETANQLTTCKGQIALDNAHNILSDVVTEYVRTAEKAETT